MRKVVKCGQLFTSAQPGVQKDVSVIINDNKIEAVVPTSVADTDGAEVYDLSDKFVMPGLIDAHVHVVCSGEANTVAGFHTAMVGDWAVAAVKNAEADLMAGFTTVRDESGIGYVDVSVKNAINRGVLNGPRMKVAGMSLSATGGHGDSHYNPATVSTAGMSYICNSPDECRAAARTTFKYGADHLKIMGTGGVMSIGDEPGAPEFTYEELKAAIDIATMKGHPSSVHAHGAQGIKNAIRAGITSVEHGMLMDDECIDMMVEHGTYLVPTIIAAKAIVDNGVAAGINPDNVAKAELCLQNHYENLKKCRAKGVKISFGTDCGTPFSYHGTQGVEFALMVEAGFTPEETLLSATKTNAELLRMEKEVGTVEPGKFADLVAFDESPLDNIKVMTAPAFVMKDGTVYKK